MTHGFKTGTKFRLGLSHALRHGTNFSATFCQENDDAIRFSQFVGAEHDPFVAVDRAFTHL
jgi:hypothetical protein